MKNLFAAAPTTSKTDGLSLLTRGDFPKEVTPEPALVRGQNASSLSTGKTILNIAKDVAQGTARSVASVGLTAINPILKVFNQKPLDLKPEDYTAIPKAIFGNEGVQDLPTRTARFKVEHPTLSGPGGILAAPIVIGATGLDLTGFGGTKVGREALELALKESKTAEEALSILKKAGVADDIATKYAPRFAAETDAKIIKEGVDSLDEVLKTTKAAATDVAKVADDVAPEVRPLLNAERLAVSPEARKFVTETIESVRPELEKIKGGPLTHDEVLKAAGDSEVLTQATSRAETLQREAELLRLRQSISAMAETETVTKEFVDSLKTASTEATSLGRMLNALRMDANPELVTNKEYLIKELAKIGMETDKIVEAAKGVNFDNVNEATQFYRTFVKPTLGQIVDEYRYINLLSSPRTHIINSFTNMLQAVGLRPVTKLASGLVDMVGSTLRGAEREKYLKEVPAYYKGVINSVGQATQNFLKAFRGEITMYRPDINRIPTGLKIFKPFQVIPRLLDASDQFFTTLIKAGERESLVTRFAQQGKDLNAGAMAEIESKADDIAKEYTFRKALDGANKTGQGKLLSAIDKFTAGVYQLRKVPGVKWFIPFVQTPMNILKQGMEYSPLGLATLPGAVDKTEQIAKALVGSTVMAGAGALALQGRTTWSAPVGDKEKKEFYASGRKAYSVKIGDNWVSYTKLGPLAYPIAMASAIQWFVNESPKSATDTGEKKLANILGGIGQFFSDQSYVQGMNNLLQAISGDLQGLKNAATTVPGQLIPLASLQRWTAQIIDPVYRAGSTDFSIKSVIDNLIKGIPFASKTLEPIRDPAGKPSTVQHPGLRALTPFDVGTEVPKYEKRLQLLRREQRLRAIQKQRKDAAKKGGSLMVNHF